MQIHRITLLEVGLWNNECKWSESLFQNDNTCSLFLIQHETTGGLPLKEQVTRAARPAFSVRCSGGFLKCNTAPAKTKQSQCFDSESKHVLWHYWCRLKTPLWEEFSVIRVTKMGNRENVCWRNVTTLSICSVHIWTVLYRQTFIIAACCRPSASKQMQTTGDLPNTSRTSPCAIKCVKQSYV